MKLGRATLAALLAVALAAPASGQQFGLASFHLTWDDCGAAGSALKTSACATNPATVGRLIATFRVPVWVSVPQMMGLQATLRVVSMGATLPDWWQLASPSGCRAGNVQVSFPSPGGACPPHWHDPSAPSSGGWGYQPGRPNGLAYEAQLITIEAIPNPGTVALTSGAEYHAVTITLLGGRTAGAGACAGCSGAAAIGLEAVGLYQPVGYGDFVLFPQAGGFWVSWQCPALGVVTIDPVPPPTIYVGYTFDCATPALPRSWGQIKSLYR